MICKAKDCEYKVRTKGYCIAHYGRLWRGQEINAPLRRKGSTTECRVSWCHRKPVGRDLCVGHWHRWREGRDLNKPFRRNKKPPIYKACPTCDKEYAVSPSGAYRKYCSRRCAGVVKVGENNSNWKGGTTETDQQERNRFNRELRELIFARDSYTCQVCQAEGTYFQVDHVKSWSKHPDLRFKAENCRTLCRPCHYYVTFKRKMPSGSKWGLSLKQTGIKDLA